MDLSRGSLFCASAYPNWSVWGHDSLSPALPNCAMAWVLGVVHYDEAWTEVMLNGVAVVELGLLEANCAMLYVVSTVGRDRID